MDPTPFVETGLPRLLHCHINSSFFFPFTPNFLLSFLFYIKLSTMMDGRMDSRGDSSPRCGPTLSDILFFFTIMNKVYDLKKRKMEIQKR